MKSIYQFRRKAIAVAVSSVIAGGINGVVQAQDILGDQLEEVVVTGSRIKRADLASVTPVSVVGAEEFKISGSLNIEQKLAELPQTLPSFGPSSNNPGDGTARVDLRGLGTARTLVLVNGRRYIPSTQTGVVDLNTIPGTLIKQVDVTTGGASAVYGSDALSGVVNFQLVDDFQGAEITALYDITDEGDAEKINVDLTIGGNFDEGRGNAVVYGSYSRRDALLSGERDFSSVTLGESNGALIPGGSSRTLGTNAGGFGQPGRVTFESDGTSRPFQDPADRFNFAPDNFLQIPQERFLISSLAHYDLNESATVYSEFTFIQNKVDQELAPTPAAISNVTINPDSPFFDAPAQAGLNSIRSDTNGDGIINGDDNAVVGSLFRRLRENGSRQTLDTRDGNRLLVGLKGELTDNWSYDAFYSRSSLDRTNTLNNDASASRLRQGLLVTDDGTACQDTSNGCVPVNIFGAGNISDAAVSFINIGATNFTSIEQTVAQASVSGLLNTLPTASQPIGVVLGLERREDESNFRPDTFLATGDVLGFNAGTPTVGGFEVDEFFTEVSVPLISERPGIESLDLWGAYRYSDYSNIGGVDSFATALSYAPQNQVSFRVGYQEAVRAPNVSELFLGSANNFPSATDPCSAGGFNPGTTSVSVCEAAGVPAGQVGAFIQTNAQIESQRGGNADLEEESSDTFTVGVVFQPSNNLDITLDYFDIQIDNAISVLGGSANNVLNICHNQVQDLTSPFCQAISRGPDGNVSLVRVRNENISSLETSGIDLQVNYATELGDGSNLNVDMRGTYLLDYDITPVSELGTVNECAGTFGNTCGSPLNDLIVNTRVSWSKGPWLVSGLLRYLSSVDDDTISTANANRASIVVPEIDDEFYLDLTASYEFSDDFRVNVGIKNLLDTEPTALGGQAEQSNTFPSTYDLLGPRVFFSSSYRFR